jgi:hypothetical protein
MQFRRSDPGGFETFTGALARRDLDVEEQLHFQDDLEDLERMARWWSDWRAFDVEHANPATSNLPRRSPHDDSEYSTAEAAAELGMSPQHVLRLVKQGVLVGRKVNARSTLIMRPSVQAFKARRAG